MNAEFFDAILQIEREKGIPASYMKEKIAQALITAFKRDNAGYSENVYVDLDDQKRTVRMYVRKLVVEEVENGALEILPDAAREYLPGAQVGDEVEIEQEIGKAGRIAAQTAKQVIVQGIREAERGMIFQEFTSKEHEILTGVVSRVDPRGGAMLEMGGGKQDKTELLLTAGEQSPNDNLKEGDHVKVYVVEVRRSARGPQVLISRTHPGLVSSLFELEVPEIREGLIEIRSVAREAGSRTKMAVWTSDEKIDPIGTCVGPRGARVGVVVDELRGEKIDIIRYSDDPSEFVAQALAPADVLSVELDKETRSCRVIVPEDQLSLAIGKEGQNARLAAKLTGFKIDIKAEGYVDN